LSFIFWRISSRLKPVVMVGAQRRPIVTEAPARLPETTNINREMGGLQAGTGSGTSLAEQISSVVR